MIERKEAREIKTCCATFYQSDIVCLLLGNVLHPGGLELTGLPKTRLNSKIYPIIPTSLLKISETRYLR